MLVVYASREDCHIFRVGDNIVLDFAKACSSQLEHLENGNTLYLRECSVLERWGVGITEAQAKEQLKEVILKLFSTDDFLDNLTAFLQKNLFKIYTPVNKEQIQKYKLRVEC